MNAIRAVAKTSSPVIVDVALSDNGLRENLILFGQRLEKLHQEYPATYVSSSFKPNAPVTLSVDLVEISPGVTREFGLAFLKRIKEIFDIEEVRLYIHR